MIFTPNQTRQLRAIRSALKVLGELDREQPSLRNWQAAAGQARAALTIIQDATGIDRSLEPDLAAALAAASIGEGVQAQIEEWSEVIEIEEDVEITAAQQAVEEIFNSLYAQLVTTVETLEAITAEPSQVNVTERPLQDRDDGWDNLRVCEVCGDKYCVAPATKCGDCQRQAWIDKHG